MNTRVGSSPRVVNLAPKKTSGPVGTRFTNEIYGNGLMQRVLVHMLVAHEGVKPE